MDEVLIVLTNVPNLMVAKTVARYLVGQKMAACVNIQPGVKSYYRWEGVIRQANEVTLSIKTTRLRYPEVEAAIRAMHPHQLPEIIALQVSEGWQPYTDWIIKESSEDMNAS